MSYRISRLFLKSKERKEEVNTVSTLLQTITVGNTGTRSPALTPISVATFPSRATIGKPLGLTTWAAVRPTMNDLQGRQL
jgi:hypothetical protein